MKRSFRIKNKVRKAAAVLMIPAMLASFTGCSKGNPAAPESPGNEVPSDTKEKLTIALVTDSFITDYEDNYLTRFLEKELGIDIEIYELPSDDPMTKVSLMVSSGDELPDIFLMLGISGEARLDYGSKGVFLPLNDYLSDPSIAPNFNAIPEKDREDMLAAGTSADGNIYAMTRFEPNPWNQTPNRFYINKTWLDKLGLKTPGTTDEYYQVLKAFANDDPNGNGVKDEIGVYGLANESYGENICNAIMNAFVFYNKDLALSEDGTTVIAPYVTDEWKDGLEYMNKLYKEGLLASSIFTDDVTQFKAVLNNESANIVGSVTTGSYSSWTEPNSNKNFQDMEIMAPLTGPQGINYTPYSEYNPAPMFYVTSSCKNPELAVKLGDLFYRRDVSITAKYCEEGVDWTDDPAVTSKYTNLYVEKGIYDKISFVYLHNYWGENSNKFWRDANLRYAPLSLTDASVDAGEQSTLKSTMQTFNYQNYYDKHPKYILPSLKYTLEETESVTEMKAMIPEYVDQSLAEFVTGARPFSDWDNYKKELDGMGLQEYLKTAQGAYDRMKK